MHIGSVAIDCNDFATMSVLGGGPPLRARVPAEEDWVVLRDPAGVNVNVSLQQVPETAPEKNRLHFDLYTTDPRGEIDRLLEIGATRHPREPEPNEDFVVLADPEGNLFCVIDVRES